MYAVAPKGTARPACAHCATLVTTWVVACRRASYMVPSELSLDNVIFSQPAYNSWLTIFFIMDIIIKMN